MKPTACLVTVAFAVALCSQAGAQDSRSFKQGEITVTEGQKKTTWPQYFNTYQFAGDYDKPVSLDVVFTPDGKEAQESPVAHLTINWKPTGVELWSFSMNYGNTAGTLRQYGTHWAGPQNKCTLRIAAVGRNGVRGSGSCSNPPYPPSDFEFSVRELQE